MSKLPTNRKQGYHHGHLRADVLKAAVQVIARDGVEALSLRSIARDLGVSHAAPARHFSTKTELLAAVAEDSAADLARVTLEAIKGAKDGLDRLTAMGKAYVLWAVKNPTRYGVLRNPEIMRHADKALKERLKALTLAQKNIITAAQSLGWKPGIDPDFLLFQILSTLAGCAIVMSTPHYSAIHPGLHESKHLELTLKSLFG